MYTILQKFDRLTPPTRTTRQPAPASQKTVINLSNHQLTDTENRVLGLGLNFAGNSRHFIVKINNINIGPTDLLVSFDIECLFTNVPVTEACDIIKTRLEQDTTLDTRTALSTEQIHDLLLTCLKEQPWDHHYHPS